MNYCRGTSPVSERGWISATLPEQDHSRAPRQTDRRGSPDAYELGRIGLLLGSKEQVSAYFAMLLALVFAVVIILLIFFPIPPGIERKDAIQTVITLFSSAVAYVFGSAASK